MRNASTIPTKQTAQQLNTMRPSTSMIARFEAKYQKLVAPEEPKVAPKVAPKMVAKVAAKVVPTMKAPLPIAQQLALKTQPKIRAKAVATPPIPKAIAIPKASPKATPKASPKAKSSGITLVDYSDKAIAVIGDTKPIKELLKSIGGRWNAHLKCGAGWIFSKTKTAQLQALVS